MPTIKKRKYKKIHKDRLTDDQLDYLVSGSCLDPSDWSTGHWIEPTEGYQAREWIPFESEAAMESAWKRHRVAVVKQVELESSWNDRKIPWAQEVFEK